MICGRDFLAVRLSAFAKSLFSPNVIGPTAMSKRVLCCNADIQPNINVRSGWPPNIQIRRSRSAKIFALINGA
jgi:hypothetical protein